MILVAGCMGYDSIETPSKKVQRIIGGAGNYSSLAACIFQTVKVVSSVGEDYSYLNILSERNIDISEVEIKENKSFCWKARYTKDLKDAETLSIELNSFEDFSPKLQDSTKKIPFVFLSNMDPEIQMSVLKQASESFILLDTMDYWIREKKKVIQDMLTQIDALIINETEIQLLTGQTNTSEALEQIHKMNLDTVILKKGKDGFTISHKGEVFSGPGHIVENAVDPTGAGDTFAGAFLGVLSSCYDKSDYFENLKKASIYGNILSSFVIQDFGVEALLNLTREQIEERLRDYNLKLS